MKDMGRKDMAIRQGNPARLGAHFDGEGTNFALFSEHASRVESVPFFR